MSWQDGSPREGEHRLDQLRTATGLQIVLLAGAIGVAAVAGSHLGSASRYTLIVLLALAMGIQNATARRLAVADLTTTVLTLTLTGIAADSRLAGGPGTKTGRRLLAVAAMALGALAGALLLPQGRPRRAPRPRRGDPRRRLRGVATRAQ